MIPLFPEDTVSFLTVNVWVLITITAGNGWGLNHEMKSKNYLNPYVLGKIRDSPRISVFSVCRAKSDGGNGEISADVN